MKGFKVSEKCNACGRCVIMTDLLIEKPDGKAVPSDIGYICDEFMFEALNIVDTCPVDALSIIESGNTKSTGKNGLKELEKLLKKRLQMVDVPEVTIDYIRFNADNYFIDYTDARGQYDYIYSSVNQASRAALDEFNRIAYSQNKVFILSVLVQYKNDKLKPFYTLEANENSFYYKTNKIYEEVLKEIATEAKALTNGKLLLPRNFDTFEVYPGDSNEFTKDRIYGRLKEFEFRESSSRIMTEFKSASYHSLDSYRSYMDIDYMEQYDGEGLFGKTKYKTKYCFDGVYEAVNEYIKDLKNSMNYVHLDRTALNDINGAINAYKEEIVKAVEKKNKDFSEAIAKI